MKEPGIIYLLSNPAMPGIIKIGMSTREEISFRMQELFTSGVPLPFVCEYAAKVNDIAKVEAALHTAFAPNRINPKREFFEIDPNQAVAIIKLLEEENITPNAKNVNTSIDSVEVAAGVSYSKRRPRFNFTEMGIPVGSTLTNMTTSEEAIVIDDRTVNFRGQAHSLTNATRLALGDGYAYNVAPGPYWTYNGKKLRQIYDETYTTEL